MGKSSAKREVVEYRMSIHLGVGYGPMDAIKRILINQKLAWSGRLEGAGTININQPNLFGGKKKEGGVVGAVHVLPGDRNQVLPEFLAAKLGRTSAEAPGFRELFTLWFTGNGTVSNANKGGAGIFATALNGVSQAASSAVEGFLWSMNSPIVAQDVWVGVERAPIFYNEADEPVGLDPLLALIPSETAGEPDANPAHIIFECYLNDDWGRGESVANMDLVAYAAAAQMLYDEGFGLSFKWVAQSDVDDFITEVNTHIQANTFLDPTTGLNTIKLLRDDYDAGTLQEINPDNAQLSDYKARLAGEMINEITVKYTNRENEEEKTVTLQDIASASVQGISADTHEYPGIRNPALAMTACERDVRYAVAPLISCEAEVDRSAWKLLPGAVVLLNWPEHGAVNVVMRVGKVNYGKPGDTKVRVPLMQDIFSLAKRPVSAVPPTEWVDTREQPAAMAQVQVLTIPAYFAQTAYLQAQPVPLTYPEALGLVLGYQPGYDTYGFDLVSEGVLSDSTVGLVSAGTKPLVERAALAVALVAEAHSTIPGDIVLDADRGPRVGGYAFIGYGDENSEIALITEFSNGDMIVDRGVLDTKPRAWAIGTPVWFVNFGARVVDDTTVRSAGEEVDYQLLTKTSLGTLDVGDAPHVLETLTDRPHLPLRPANCKVNGTAFGTHALAAAPNITLTWATRNRRLEEGQTVAWDAASVPGEYRQATVISAYDDLDALIISYAFWDDTEFVVAASEFDRFSTVRFEFSSTRDSLDSINNHSVYLSGLANNPAAPLPAPAPALGEPPSPVLQPAVGAFAIVGNAISTAAGGSAPAIIIAGEQDDQDAEGLIARYKKTGDALWSHHETLVLNRLPVRLTILAVKPVSEYAVEVAYIQAGIVGEYRSIGPVTTGALTSDDTANVGGVPAATVISDIDDLYTIYGDTASAAASAAAAAASASAATTAKNLAETARDDAQAAYTAADAAATLAGTYAGNAASSSTAASSAASAAAASQTAAAASQTASAGSATAAAASQTAAAGSASAAASSATSAASSATAAGSSATASEASRVEATATAAALFPSTFAQDGTFWGFLTADSTVVSTFQDTSEGRTIRLTGSGYGVLDPKQPPGRISVSSAAGRKYRAVAKVRYYADGINGQWCSMFGIAVDSAGGFVGYWSPYGAAPGTQSERQVHASEGWVLLGADFNAPTTGVFTFPRLAFNWSNGDPGGHGSGGTFEVAYFKFEDITESAAAGVSATASATSASSASASQSAAASSASAASSSETNAATSAASASTYAANASSSATSAAGSASTATTQAGIAVSAKDASETVAKYQHPTTFEQDALFFAGDADQTAPFRVLWDTDTTSLRYAKNNATDVYGAVSWKACRPHTPNAKYRMTVRAKVFSGLLASVIDIRVSFYNSSDGSNRIHIEQLWPTLTNAWASYTLEVDSSLLGGGVNDSLYVRPEVILNYPSMQGVVGLSLINLEDVTSEKAAAGSATAAAGSASSAAASQSAAGASATSATASANTATTQAGNSANSATAAATSASGAASSQTAAASSASAASSSAVSASTALDATRLAGAALLPSDFEADSTFWTNSSYSPANALANQYDASHFTTVSGIGRVWQSLAGESVLFPVAHVVPVVGRRYRLEGKLRAVTDNTAGGHSYTMLRILGCNADYSIGDYIAGGAEGYTHTADPLTVAEGWVVWRIEWVCPTGYPYPLLSFWLYPNWQLGPPYISGNQNIQVQYLKFTDITESKAAADSATASAASASSAAASQTAAGSSASAAATSETNAATSAGSAATSASAASTSATSASSSASTATTQAANAATSATAAAASQTAAAGSATASASSASAASTSASDASTSASTATTQAGIATSQAGAASTSAGSAATSATSAAGSASAAASSNTLAASANTAAGAAAAATLPSTFTQDGRFWSSSWTGTPVGRAAGPYIAGGLISYVDDADHGRCIQIAGGNYSEFAPVDAMRVQAGHTYKVSMLIKAVTDYSGSGALNSVWFRAAWLIADYTTGGTAGGAYPQAVAAGWVTYSVTVAANDYPTAVWLRPNPVLNYPDGQQTWRIAWVKIEDITESTAAAGSAAASASSASSAAASQTAAASSAASATDSANTATTQAGNSSSSASAASSSAAAAATSASGAASSATSATASANTATTQAGNASTSASSASSSAAAASSSAAAAASSATLSAKITGRSMNINPAFSSWAGTNPDGLANYYGTGTFSKVSGKVSDNAARFTAGAGVSCGYSTFDQALLQTARYNDYLVLEAVVTLVSGTLQGAAISALQLYASGGLAYCICQFASDPDVSDNVIGNGVVGQTYTFSKLVRLTNALTTRIWLEIGNHSQGDISAASTVDFHYYSVRPASAAEIAGQRADANATTALAQISSNAAAQATVNSAQATTNGSVAASISGHTSSISTNASAIADVNGRLSATYAVTVGAGDRFASFKLLTASGGGTEVSSFDIAADKFRVYNGTSSVAAFEVSGGVAYVGGSMVRTASMETGAVQRVSFDQTSGLGANCVNRSGAADPSGRALMKTYNFTVDSTGKLKLFFLAQIEHKSGNRIYCYMKVTSVASPTWTTDNVMTNADAVWQMDGVDGDRRPCIGMTVFASGLTPGSHTVEVYWNDGGSGTHSHECNDALFDITEGKKSA